MHQCTSPTHLFLCFCLLFRSPLFSFFFFFNDTATTEIYTLSLHDALPIWNLPGQLHGSFLRSDRAHAEIVSVDTAPALASSGVDRKSTRLNSSHSQISYAVFCLKKKKKKEREQTY